MSADIRILIAGAILLAAASFIEGRKHPFRPSHPNHMYIGTVTSMCVVRYDLENLKTGIVKQFCLNPVNQKTGIADSFSEQDWNDMGCVAGWQHCTEKNFGADRER